MQFEDVNEGKTSRRKVTVELPKESSIDKRYRELMALVAKEREARGIPYVEPKPVEPEPYVEPQQSPPSPFSVRLQRRREIEQAETHEVYFLYSCNRVKIGTSRHHLRRIMREISPCCPAPLNLIGVIPGGPIVESRLHKRFEAAFIRDEWFALTPDLRAYLCEDETRADRLEDAEDHYRDWLMDELNHLEGKDEIPPDRP